MTAREPTELPKIRKNQFMLYYDIVKVHKVGTTSNETGINCKRRDDLRGRRGHFPKPKNFS